MIVTNGNISGTFYHGEYSLSGQLTLNSNGASISAGGNIDGDSASFSGQIDPYTRLITNGTFIAANNGNGTFGSTVNYGDILSGTYTDTVTGDKTVISGATAISEVRRNGVIIGTRFGVIDLHTYKLIGLSNSGSGCMVTGHINNDDFDHQTIDWDSTSCLGASWSIKR